MKNNIRDFKYIVIKNFFSKEELKFLKIYCENKIDDDDFITYPQSPLTPSWYKDTTMNSIATLKKELVEKETGLSLFETYTFWRAYMYGSILKDHVDRESCEISVTANIAHSEPWPIHMENHWIKLEPGDALVYLGCELKHGRKPFEGEYNFQVFMHFVDQNGPYKDFNKDDIWNEK